MVKHKAHQAWQKFRSVKPWYFLVLFVISLAVTSFALRANNEHMITLRNAVYAADKKGSNVEAALKNLQAYVTSHMNTNLSSGPNAVYPPIQLKYTYERLQNAQKIPHTNAELYTDAENYCQALIPTGFSGRYRVPCIEQYIQTHGVNSTPQTIPPSLYEFDFISPSWSPDLAGWSLVVTVLLFVLFIISWLAKRISKHAKANIDK